MASFLEQLIQRAGTAGKQMGTPAVLDKLSQLIKGGVGGAGSVMSNVPGMQPSGEALTALANLIPQEKPKDAVQYMTENARKLGISEIHQGVDEAGGHSVKVKFNSDATTQSETPQSKTTTQEQPNIGQQGIQALKGLLGGMVGNNSVPATGQMVSAPNMFGLGGLNAQGNYEDQGMLTKLLQMVSVGGGKPGTGPAEAMAIQKMAGMEPLQQKDIANIEATKLENKKAALEKANASIDAEMKSIEGLTGGIKKMTVGGVGGPYQKRYNYLITQKQKYNKQLASYGGVNEEDSSGVSGGKTITLPSGRTITLGK